jgi:hypothetical protein
MNRKSPISATIDNSLIEWIDQTLSDSREFRNKSHIIETAIIELKEKLSGKRR